MHQQLEEDVEATAFNPFEPIEPSPLGCPHSPENFTRFLVQLQASQMQSDKDFDETMQRMDESIANFETDFCDVCSGTGEYLPDHLCPYCKGVGAHV